MPDVLERPREPGDSPAIQEWSEALTDVTHPDQLPLTQPYIEKITGAAYAALLNACEWQIEP